MSALNSISYPQPSRQETITLGAGESLTSTNVTLCDIRSVEIPQDSQIICLGGVCSLGNWKPRIKKLND
jgi:hypothetical protein